MIRELRKPSDQIKEGIQIGRPRLNPLVIPHGDSGDPPLSNFLIDCGQSLR